MKNFYIGSGQIDGDRDYQEDYLETIIIDNNASLLVLADGMGGYEGGERASKTVVRTFIATFDKLNPNIKDALHKALMKANQALKEEKIKYPHLKQMGTTLLAVYIHVNYIQWISLGDSPLWLISSRYDKRYHKPAIKRINKNHSIAGLLQLQLEQGEITKEIMDLSPNKHVLTSAVIGEELEIIDLSEKLFINNDDIIILASDGIETISKNEILKIISNSVNTGISVKNILDAIKSKKSPEQDNSSIIIITNKEKESSLSKNSMSKTQPIVDNLITDKNKLKKSKLSIYIDNNYKMINMLLVFIIILLLILLF